MATLDKVLGSLMPDKVVDVDADFSVQSIYDELFQNETQYINALIDSGNYTSDQTTVDTDVLMKRAEEVYAQRLQEVEIMQQKANSVSFHNKLYHKI